MCGHLGFAYHDPRREPRVADLERCARTIHHRGPDDFGVWTRNGVGAAFRRLSIIDLEGGHQPLVDASGEIALVANGEVYNFRELRTELESRGHVFRTGSDCETVLHGYREWGPAIAERLVGMIAFAICDTRDERARVVLGRDRLGIKPLYWMETEDGLAWASEPKALLEAGWTSRRLRRSSLLDYLVQGYCGGPRAAWEGIERLPPGSILTWSQGGTARVERYWDLPLESEAGPVDESRLGSDVLELLDRVVADRLVADVPLGAFLSGGIDSTAVVTSMARLSSEPVIACSVGFHEKSHDELATAIATAERLGAVHHTEVLEPDPRLALDVLPWLYDEPHADPSTVPTYLVSKMAREHVTVALSGDGGDETFAGYRRYVHDVAENRLRRRLGPAARALGALGRVYPKLDWAPRFLRAKTFLENLGRDPAQAYFTSVAMQSRHAALALLNPDLAASLADHDPYHAFRVHYDRPRSDDPLYRAQYADFHTYLPDQILTKVDRASMGVSLEVRVPILDHRFVERFAVLPPAAKVAAGRGKHAFREALRARIPGSVLDGKKRGFDTPLAAWTRGPLAGPVRDAVESLPAEWFDRARVRGILSEHAAGRRDHGRLLWSLLVLEHWRERHSVRGLGA